MIIYGLGTCDTCRKARKALPQAKFVDVRENGVPAKVLQSAFDAFGAKLLNTRSKTWKALPETQRAGAPLDLIIAHPLLMKRPLIDADGALYLGWTPDVQAALATGT